MYTYEKPSLEEIEAELGGVEGFFTLFGIHYCNMFANPRMSILFDVRNADTNVSAYEHGKRVAAVMLNRWHGTNHWKQLNRGQFFNALEKAHQRAKRCPMRPKEEQVKRPEGHPRAQAWFTVKQRDSWLGHVVAAAEECGASKTFQKKLGSALSRAMPFYAPFADEETGEIV